MSPGGAPVAHNPSAPPSIAMRDQPMARPPQMAPPQMTPPQMTAPNGPIQQVAYTQPAYCPPGMQAPGAMPPGYAPPMGVMPTPYPHNHPGAMLPPGAATGPPAPFARAVYPADPYGQWQPPHIGGAWPRDEYVFDGGDRRREVAVNYDWTVRGLDTEDTVAHFDTVDGDLVVEPSNRTPIYSPRFAAVRKVYGIGVWEGNERLIAAKSQSQVMQEEELRIPTTMLQPVEARGEIGVGVPSNLTDRTRGLTVTEQRKVAELAKEVGPHDDFQIFHRGVFLNSEKVRLSQFAEAADAWSHNQAPQVLFDAETAEVESSTRASQAVYVNTKIPTHPRLRLVKTASVKAAHVGDIVEFTLRYDNIGDEVIGNVTIIDNLTARLEYVADSAQSDRESALTTTPNDSDSLILRWELAEPLEAGEGGVIRFQCRVR